MVSKLDRAFNFQKQVMNLRTERQQLIASNIANADTPHYKARDLDFGKSLQAALAGRGAGNLEMARSASGHLPGLASLPARDLMYRNEYQSSVDGNTVEMDVERANFSDNAIRYEASVTFVSGQFNGLREAMQSTNA